MIYFIQPTDGGPIKIGYSANVEERRSQLESYFGRELAVLAIMKGDREEEKRIHRLFDHLRLGRTEQFRPKIDLMTFIGRPLLVASNPDTVELLESAKIDIRFRLDDDLYRRVKDAADREGNSVAAFIRSAVAEELKRREDGRQ